MNETQSDRDTKAHMLIHSVNFTISLPPYLSLFFTLPSSLSHFPVNWPLYHWLQWSFLSLCVLALQVCWVSRQVYCVRQLLCQAPTKRAHSLRTLLHVHACMCACTCKQACASHPSWHEWASKSYPLPLYHIFSASLIPSLPLSSFSRALLEEQSWRECDNRGINQMYMEVAWLAQSMRCFYLPNAMWIGLLLPEKCLCVHLEWGALPLALVTRVHVFPVLAPSQCSQFFIFISA